MDILLARLDNIYQHNSTPHTWMSHQRAPLVSSLTKALKELAFHAAEVVAYDCGCAWVSKEKNGRTYNEARQPSSG